MSPRTRTSACLAAALVTALLALVTLIGWARSHLIGDWIDYYDEPAGFSLWSNGGLIVMSWGELWSRDYPPPPGWRGSFWPFERETDTMEVDIAGLVGGTTLGFGYAAHARDLPTLRWDGRTVVFPWWAVTLVPTIGFVALAAPPAVRAVRRRRRHGDGQCPACGYDLRATPGRCPECGRVPANPG